MCEMCFGAGGVNSKWTPTAAFTVPMLCCCMAEKRIIINTSPGLDIS